MVRYAIDTAAAPSIVTTDRIARDLTKRQIADSRWRCSRICRGALVDLIGHSLRRWRFCWRSFRRWRFRRWRLGWRLSRNLSRRNLGRRNLGGWRLSRRWSLRYRCLLDSRCDHRRIIILREGPTGAPKGDSANETAEHTLHHTAARSPRG